MKDRQDVISDIRRSLKSGLYEVVQYIRISLVADICYSLNWNIWNPSEFSTEFSVVRTKVVTDRNDSIFTESSLSFKAAVDHCKRASKAAGFSETDLIIGYIKL